MVEGEIISARLERLKGYLLLLKNVRKLGPARFREDPFVRGAAERYLHLSIECLLDIGNHIIADRNFEKPETYADIFEVLAAHRVISGKLMREVEGMAAFRNILVHDYLKIDPEKVFGVIKEKLPAFEALAKVYAGLL